MLHFNQPRKRYEGTAQPEPWDHTGAVDVYVEVAQGWDGRPLRSFLDEVNHSPTGFAWAYGGSGPAQLAYAILRDFTDSREIAEALYQHFKQQIIAQLPRGGFMLPGENVLAWLESYSDVVEQAQRTDQVSEPPISYGDVEEPEEIFQARQITAELKAVALRFSDLLDQASPREIDEVDRWIRSVSSDLAVNMFRRQIFRHLHQVMTAAKR